MTDATRNGVPLADPGGGALRLRYTAVSDLGRHRKDNQDSGYASEHLLVVADGVGGAAYGDVASSTAVQLLRRLDAPPGEEMLGALAGAVHRVHDRLAELVEADPELDGTSTTITAALFDGRRIAVAHVGDSRAYLMRDGALAQLTKDHTFVQTLVDEGRITEADSRVHPHRNIILRAVDGTHAADPDLFHVDLRPGDRLLLCSDGCSGAVTDDELGRVLSAESIDAAAVGLVQAALDNGTTDNVTVVVAEVVAPGTADEADTQAAVSTGPMLVGAAASQPRRGGVIGRALGGRRPKAPAGEEPDDDPPRVAPVATRTDTGELDPVPADPADDLDPEQLRYAPLAPPRRTGLRRLLLVVLALAVVVGVLAAAWAWIRTQYYVAANGTEVAIYRGVDVEVGGLDLSEVHASFPELGVDALPPAFRTDVRAGIEAPDGLDQAQSIVAELEARAEALAEEERRQTARREERRQERREQRREQRQQDRQDQQDQQDQQDGAGTGGTGGTG